MRAKCPVCDVVFTGSIDRAIVQPDEGLTGRFVNCPTCGRRYYEETAGGWICGTFLLEIL